MKENNRLRKFSIYKVSEWQNQDLNSNLWCYNVATASAILLYIFYFSGKSIFSKVLKESHSISSSVVTSGKRHVEYLISF